MERRHPPINPNLSIEDINRIRSEIGVLSIQDPSSPRIAFLNNLLYPNPTKKMRGARPRLGSQPRGLAKESGSTGGEDH